MGECPEENVLVMLALGTLESPSMRATLQAHLDGCATCRSVVAAVAEGSAPRPRPKTANVLVAGTALGRYQIVKLLGVGGMGVLYEGLDTRLNRRVAIKLLNPGFDDATGKARLEREAQAMAQLSHPGVVNVFDLGDFEGQLFLVLELVDGGTLRDWLAKPRTWKEALKLLGKAGDGLAAAHRAGVVHRDFKPENVMVGADGRARVTDFGLARPDESGDRTMLTQTGMLVGTPAYMAPEQLDGQRGTALSDQYSFAVSVYEALFDQRPFQSTTLLELRLEMKAEALKRPAHAGSAVPKRVWDAIARALSVDPEQRFPSMEALLLELKKGRAKAEGSAWVEVGAILGVGVAVLGLATAAVVSSQRQEPPPVAALPPPAPPVLSVTVESPPVVSPADEPRVALVASPYLPPSLALSHACPQGMRLVPKGAFLAGTAKDDPMMGYDERPLGPIDAAAFCIDVFEFPNKPGAAPVIASFAEAERFCAASAKRLCTELEWEKSCKGPGNLRWPYGNAFDPEACATENSEGEPRLVNRSGNFTKCRSGYGVSDLSGNAAEWTADHGLKGGDSKQPDYAVRCSARKVADRPGSLAGFRCCASPAD